MADDLLSLSALTAEEEMEKKAAAMFGFDLEGERRREAGFLAEIRRRWEAGFGREPRRPPQDREEPS
jgi:hypothetical protein